VCVCVCISLLIYTDIQFAQLVALAGVVRRVPKPLLEELLTTVIYIYVRVCVYVFIWISLCVYIYVHVYI